jgi:hypothetical protein
MGWDIASTAGVGDNLGSIGHSDYSGGAQPGICADVRRDVDFGHLLRLQLPQKATSMVLSDRWLLSYGVSRYFPQECNYFGFKSILFFWFHKERGEFMAF